MRPRAPGPFARQGIRLRRVLEGETHRGFKTTSQSTPSPFAGRDQGWGGLARSSIGAPNTPPPPQRGGVDRVCGALFEKKKGRPKAPFPHSDPARSEWAGGVEETGRVVLGDQG